MLLFSVFVLYGCRTDSNIFGESKGNQKKKIFYYLSKKEVTNKSVLKKIDEIQTKNKTLSKTIENPLAEATINEEKILVVEDSNKNKTYTFSIQRKNKSLNSPIENIVIYKDANGNNKAYLIKYNITKPEKEDFLIGKMKNLPAKMEIYSIDENNHPSSLSQKGSGVYDTTISYYDEDALE